ncbi:MAG: RDD family protein [Alphaproteobacteria bacterium]
MPINLPDRADAPFTWEATPPDPLTRPEYYRGVLSRRILAFLVDMALLTAVMAVLWTFNLLTFGLLSFVVGLLWPAIIVAYAAWRIGGEDRATYGMRLFGLQVRSWNGRPASILQAAIMAIVFLVTVPATSGLVLLVALFADRRRCLHDMLAGVIVVNTAGDKQPER